MLHVRHLIIALALGAAIGCGSDDKDSNGPDGTGQTSETSVTVTISAEEGGEVKLGKAVLSIPAGALAEDLEVTLESKAPAASLPDQDTLKGQAYDFGPDGTTFETPVSLTLPLAGTPGDDETAVVSWYDEENETWQDLPATVDGDSITAEVEHFTLFIVRFKGVAPGSFDCSFEACGAEGIEGSWSMAGACIEQPNSENPFAAVAGCEDAVFDIGVEAEGTVTFEAGSYDYQWTFTGMMNLDLSAACFEAIGQGTACEDFSPEEGVVCATEGGRCVCAGPAGDPEESVGTGTYEVSGNGITFMDADDTEPETHEACVQGDSAKLQMVETEVDAETGEESTQTTTLVLTRN